MRTTTVAAMFGYISNPGAIPDFTDEQIKSCTIHEEIDLISNELVPNTLELEVYLTTDDFANIEPKLTQGAVITAQSTITDDENPLPDPVQQMGQFYLDTWEKTKDDILKINGISALGLLDKMKYEGSLKFINSPTKTGDFVEDLLSDTTIDYFVDDAEDKNLSGILRPSTKKEALRVACFSKRSVVYENRGNGTDTTDITIGPQNTAVVSNVGLDRVFELEKETQNEIPNKISIDYYNYTLLNNVPLTIIWKGTLVAGTTRIHFTQPINNVSTTDNHDVPLPYSFNMISAYAVDITVSSNGNYSIWGFVNPELVFTKVFNLAGDPAGSDNAISIKDTTSITSNELDSLGNNLLLFYQTFNTTFEISFISNFEETGQMYSFDVDENRNISGIIVSQDIDLAGGMRTKAKVLGNSQSI